MWHFIELRNLAYSLWTSLALNLFIFSWFSILLLVLFHPYFTCFQIHTLTHNRSTLSPQYSLKHLQNAPILQAVLSPESCIIRHLYSLLCFCHSLTPQGLLLPQITDRPCTHRAPVLSLECYCKKQLTYISFISLTPISMTLLLPILCHPHLNFSINLKLVSSYNHFLLRPSLFHTLASLLLFLTVMLTDHLSYDGVIISGIKFSSYG